MHPIEPQFFNDFFNYNSYAAHIHELNARWWQNPDGSPKELDKGERFMLMVSELSEALEADRKELFDDKLPQYPGLWVELADTVIRLMDSGAVYGWNMDCPPELDLCIAEPKTIGGHLLNIVGEIMWLASHEINCEGECEGVHQCASTIIHLCERLANECGCRDFWLIVHAKLVYNANRVDHTWEGRLAPGGKKF